MLDTPSQLRTMHAAQAAPLVMLPGTLCDRQVFAETLYLAGGLDATFVDYSEATSAPEMARLILSRAPHRFSLGGFSLGAIVALEIIAQAPERVERLALISADAGPMAPERVASRRAAYEVAKLRGCGSFIDDVWDASVPEARREDRQLRRLLDSMADDTPLDALFSQIEIAINRADSRPRLANITVPTLALCGADDRVCPPAQSREIAAAIPKSRLAIIPDAGHYVTLDQPQAVATELAAWLATPSDLKEPS